MFYSFLKSESAGATIFAPPATPTTEQYTLGDTQITRSQARICLKKPKEGHWWGEPSFQQQQAEVHSHYWFWEVWSQADTAENPHR